jgi:hypothetical protein
MHNPNQLRLAVECVIMTIHYSLNAPNVKDTLIV